MNKKSEKTEKSEKSETKVERKRGRSKKRYYCVRTSPSNLADFEIREFSSVEEIVNYMMGADKATKDKLETGESVVLPIYVGMITPFDKPVHISRQIKIEAVKKS